MLKRIFKTDFWKNCLALAALVAATGYTIDCYTEFITAKIPVRRTLAEIISALLRFF